MRVLMLSGGLDSCTMLAFTKYDLAISVDYGQPHLDEIEAARYFADREGLPHEVVTVSFQCSPSTGILGGNDRTAHESVMPGRNSLLVAIAAMRGATVVALGCNADDQDAYIDCRESVLSAVGSACGVRVEMPLVNHTKRQILRMGEVDPDLISKTISCYRGNPACGQCAACIQRRDSHGGNGDD